MDSRRDRALLSALAQVAPGSPLREGINRILQSGRGGLIVIGDGPEVLNICSGGFLLDAAFTPQRMAELAKMDGAIILAADGSRIARANVHLVPNPNVATAETGTRHRTAERVARSLNVPVVSVSESRKVIQVYVGDQSRPLEPVSRLLDRSNQALHTLERYRLRWDEVSRGLSALEVEDLATRAEVIELLQRTEMVLRIADEIDRNLVELGSDGRLVRLQLDELVGGVDDDHRAVLRDYAADELLVDGTDAVAGALRELDDDELFDDGAVAAALGMVTSDDPDEAIEPRGHRMLRRLPRVPAAVADAVVANHGPLSNLLRVTPDELATVDGVDPARADAVKQGLARLAEASILERYQRS